jgi:hypothetical protein
METLIEDFYFAVRPRLEVALVKVVHADEAVLASGRIRGARRMHGNPDPGRGEVTLNVIKGINRGAFVTYVFSGPKCPLTRPTSSSKTRCQKRASNLPCRDDVLVTSMAS